MPNGILNKQAKEILDAVTKGTTLHDRRYDMRYVRVRHVEPMFALVEWRGSSYSCGGSSTYVSGEVRFIRIPDDLSTAGCRAFWDTGKDRNRQFSHKAMLAWLGYYKDSLLDYPDSLYEATRKVMLDRKIEMCEDPGCITPKMHCRLHNK